MRKLLIGGGVAALAAIGFAWKALVIWGVSFGELLQSSFAAAVIAGTIAGTVFVVRRNKKRNERMTDEGLPDQATGE